MLRRSILVCTFALFGCKDHANETPAPTPSTDPAPTPDEIAATMLARAQGEIDAGAYAIARGDLEDLRREYPTTAAGKQASAKLQQLDQLEKERAAADETAIKALAARKSVEVAPLHITVNDVSVVRSWHFGSFGSGDMNVVADKDAQYVTVSFDVQTKSKNPQLPCPIAFVRAPKETTFHRTGDSHVAFRRWDSYGTSLGNSPDLGNDFAKSETVRFSAGVEAKTADLATKFLYVAFTKASHLTRHEDSSEQPPVEYTGTCGVHETVTLAELVNGFEIVDIRAPRSY